MIFQFIVLLKISIKTENEEMEVEFRSISFGMEYISAGY